MSARETKARIIEAAEELFAEQGFAATSLRKITAAAGTNLASVHYHFGSKEGLIGAVFAQRIGKVNGERLALLDEVLAGAGDEPPSLEQLLRAFILPTAHMARRKHLPALQRLIMRLHAEPGQDKIVRIFIAQFEEVMARFLPALQRAIPDVAEADLAWRLRFAVGGVIHAFGAPEAFEAIWQKHCGTYDDEEMVGRLIDFMTAGIRQSDRPSGEGKRT